LGSKTEIAATIATTFATTIATTTLTTEECHYLKTPIRIDFYGVLNGMLCVEAAILKLIMRTTLAWFRMFFRRDVVAN
jgi:hypothetical protein